MQEKNYKKKIRFISIKKKEKKGKKYRNPFSPYIFFFKGLYVLMFNIQFRLKEKKEKSREKDNTISTIY